MEWGIVEWRVGVLLLNYDHRDAQHVADPGQKADPSTPLRSGRDDRLCQ
jgi:hypothetical protein